MVLRLALGTVYTVMAIGQLASAASMPRILSAYGLVDGAAAAVLAGGLIVGELLCGAWFLTRPRSTAVTPVWAYTAVSLVWSALAVQAYVRGLTVTNCGCFGVYLTQRLTWFVLVQDALTLLYAALLVRGARRALAAARHNRSDDTAHSQAAKADTR
ncbi:MauE/DoxX family redox-associated membrane protein [Streptomyces sp. NPDC001401]|uniref:MauE/DoxX family redox-associated membrane protein n=1 Tax=Streptomyces sp. NPDC001401 TaxID=3364570 RepID=UPI0036907D1E